MDDTLTGIIVAIVIVVVVFLVLREFWTWWWKINQIIEGQKKTNMLLQQLLGHYQTDSENKNQTDELIIQNTATGETKGISRSEWDNLMASSPKQTKYRIIKENKPE